MKARSRSALRTMILIGVCVVSLGGSSAAWAADFDHDGIPDHLDKCPSEAEDHDGDSDEDGCPDDGDVDGDGILDSQDLCPTLAEDKDGNLDHDGCPDVKDDKDGDGLGAAQDQCPYEPEDHDGFQDRDGCPDPDNDGDGIADTFDICPMAQEDIDGFDDGDGCPDLDNDGDGIPDLLDECPNDPEDLDGHDDKDGCPDVLVVLTKDKIELKEKVFFAFNETMILQQSYPILDAVTAILNDHPELVVRIDGHTDNVGSPTYNVELSHGRAKSVRTYLIGRGIGPDRLSAVGYGPDQPLVPNDSEDNRALNRRVEFIIVAR